MGEEGLKLFHAAFDGVDGWIGLFFLNRRLSKQQALQYPTEHVQAAIEKCAELSGQGYDAYFSPAPLQYKLEDRRRGKKDDYMGSQMLWVDIDPKGSRTKDTILDEVKAFNPLPTHIVDSGNGIHAYWKLMEFVDDHSKVEHRNLWLANQLGGDHCHSIDHLLRVPGTVNWKGRTNE